MATNSFIWKLLGNEVALFLTVQCGATIVGIIITTFIAKFRLAFIEVSLVLTVALRSAVNILLLNYYSKQSDCIPLFLHLARSHGVMYFVVADTVMLRSNFFTLMIAYPISQTVTALNTQ
jgi:hypothetical protein